MIEKIYEWLKQRPEIKRKVHYCIVHPFKSRPRWWVRTFIMPCLIKKGKQARIARSVRKDLFPFNKFEIGKRSVIEDFSTLNNGMGKIIIGDNCMIGIGCVVVGDITIGNNVVSGQHCTFSGMNHNYQDLEVPIVNQGSYPLPTIIEDDVFFGSNVVVLPGVTIGTHSYIGAGSVVTKSVPPYSLVNGPAAKVTFDLKNGIRK